MLTADDVLNARFRATKFQEGYDQDEVDDFLDRVAEALKALARGEAPQLTAADLAAVRFQATKWREGYDQSEVDALLARVGEALAAPRAAAAQVRPPTQPSASPTSREPTEQAVSSAPQPGALTALDVINRLQLARASRPGADRLVVRRQDGTTAVVVDVVGGQDEIELVVS